jgi:tetratricopeptide (TPR) repeat protein
MYRQLVTSSTFNGWNTTIFSLLLLVIPAFSHAEEAESIADILSEADPALQQIEAQIEAGEYAATRGWLEARIETIEDGSNRYDPDLVRPVTLLGDVLAGQGDIVGALDQFGRAVHIERVNSGLVSPAQVQIVYRQAQAYRQMGDFEQANNREEYAWHVLRRTYEPYDEALLPGVFHLAQWYTTMNNVFSARAAYEHATDIYSAHGKAGSPEIIPALEGLADTYKFERFPPVYYARGSFANNAGSASTNRAYPTMISVNNFPAGERALQTIVRIRQNYAHSTEEIAKSMLQLADWYLLFEKTRRSDPLYQHAYELLAMVPEFDAVGYFAEPKLLHFPLPSDPAYDSGTETLGFVEVAYDITDTGHIRSLKTVASEPDGLMEFRVRKSMRAARYRPVLIDGVRINSPNRSFRHEFTYYIPSKSLHDQQQ